MKIKSAIIFVFSALVMSSPVVAKGGPGGGHGGSHISHAKSGPGEHLVSGYTTKNGTHAAPHYQTNPDGTRNDNYSTRSNINPHTGEAGTKPRDGETPN